MRNDIDVIVIGAGVNGLICATLLAQAKRRVVVLEAQADIGGACVTRELVAGHKISTFAHLIGPLDAGVMKALRLSRYGFQLTAKQLTTVALSADGRHIVLDGDLRHTAAMLTAHSPADAKAWPLYDGRMRKAAQQLERWVQAPPGGPFEPTQRGGMFASRAAAKTAALDADAAAFLDGAIGDLLDAHFETPLLKGALAFDAILGSALGPRLDGTAFLAALRRALATETTEGLAHPQGGVGAFVAALAKAADGAGVRIRKNARVANLLFDGARTTGVTLASGETLFAPVVVSSLDPRTTLLELGGERHVPLGLKRRFASHRTDGCVAKVNLALAGLPTFKGIDKKLLRERLIICPGIDYLERAFAAYEQGTYAPDPALEITIPSVHDNTLAVAGQHVLSANVLYVPKTLTEKAKADLMGRVGAVLRQYAPELPDMILAADVFTPGDIEAAAGSAGGHWHGGDLTLDQLGPMRPAFGMSRHDTPIAGLFLCGAGTHPCGGVTGINGRNAAEAVLAAATVNA